MTCFVMLTTQNGRLQPLVDDSGCATVFEDQDQAVKAAEDDDSAILFGYAVYENLNDFDPLEIEADGPDGDDGD